MLDAVATIQFPIEFLQVFRFYCDFMADLCDVEFKSVKLQKINQLELMDESIGVKLPTIAFERKRPKMDCHFSHLYDLF